MKNRKSLFKKWMTVLQYLAAYLVAAWTFLQFLEWILNRYQISPHWVDIFLWFFLGIIPSLLIYLYHQERINQRILKLREKIIFPTNLVLVLIGLYFGFYSSDLGATTKEVSFVDASGEVNQTTITKEEFRTIVPIYNFTPLTEDEELKWVGEGISALLFYDLQQDKNITPDRNYAQNTTDKVTEASVVSSLYVDGSYNKIGDEFVIETCIRSSKNGKIKSKETFKGTDFLDLIDTASLYIKNAVDMPETAKMQYLDLDLKEFLSTSIPAIKNFVWGRYEEAIALDSTFALAYLRSSRRNIRYSRGKIDEQALAEKAYRYRSRLPYDLKMEAMANRYLAYDQFDEAKQLVEMQLEISPQNVSLNDMLYGIFGETRDVQGYYEIALNRFSNTKSSYNIENIANATLVSGDYDRYLDMLGVYIKLNPGNTYIFPYALVPQLLKGDIAEARKTLDKIRLVHANYDHINTIFEEPLAYLAENSIDQSDLNFFVGQYRSQKSEALVDLWIDGGRLLNYYSNQRIRPTMLASKRKLVLGRANQFSATYDFKTDASGKPICAKVAEHYQSGNPNTYWIWKVDKTIEEAEALLQEGNYEKAAPAYEKAIAANPGHFYLKYGLQHIAYVKSKDSLNLVKQYEKVVGTYSKEGVDNTRKLFIKDGKLMYKRMGVPSRQLLPISENRYLNPSSLDTHYEFVMDDGEAVASFIWMYDSDKAEWINYGPEVNYLVKEEE